MKKRLWIIIDGLNLAGAEKQAALLALKLSEVYEVRIVHFKAADASQRVRIIQLSTESRGRVVAERLSISIFLNLLTSKSETIITFTAKSNIFGRILKFLNNRIDLITSIRNERFSNKLASVLYRITSGVQERAIYNSHSAMSRGIIEGLSSGAKSSFINNYVDEGVGRLRPVKPIRRLAYLGRIAPQKRVHWLIEAVANIQTEIPDVELLIYGYGSNINEIKSKIDEQTRIGNIQYKGPYSNIDVILDGIDMVVIPSEWEGMPNVALECAQRLVPIIGSNAGGLADIQAECSVPTFVELSSVSDLQNLIKTWLLMDPLTIANSGQELCKYLANNHNTNNITKQWLENIRLGSNFIHA